jgi:type IV pilus assembly protein PilY1
MIESTRKTGRFRGGWILCAALLSATSARADDTEIFVNAAAAAGLRPNILFIIDTSGSMRSEVTLPRAPYDPERAYAGNCNADRVYFAPNNVNNVPRCGNAIVAAVATAANTCAASTTALGTAGLWTGKAAQWDDDSASWIALQADAEDEEVECEADAGVHGPDNGSNRRYARDGDAGQHWTVLEAEAIGWAGATVYTFYSANWLNWYYSPPENAGRTRLETVQAVATNLANSIDGVNLGLMRFSNASNAAQTDFAEGGMVNHEIANLANARASIVSIVEDLTASGLTPLSETLYEAGQYFAGRDVDYGLAARIDNETLAPSVPASRRDDDQSRYQTPIEFQCQKNYAILLTDGEPTDDSTADGKIVNLPNFGALVGGDCDGNGWGRCLDDMAEYLFRADLSPLPGQQNVVTYAIGFGPDVASSAILDQTAQRGGGRSFEASNVNDLTNVLRQIVSEIVQSNGTFTAPALSINAFNRTQTTNDFYVSLFKPSDRLRWQGNVKKYSVRNGKIVDASGREAVDPATGLFLEESQSLWSNRTDGADITSGGAVSRLPLPADRRLYTYLPASASRNLTAAGNRFAVDNAALTAELLGIVAEEPTRDNVIAWARGVDVQDVDGDGDRAEPYANIGDPLHAKPVVLTYGGSAAAPNALDSVVYTPTNDGFLHAVDARTGQELWAFVPPELLARLSSLYTNPAVAARNYGLDGEIRLLRFDANQDGVLDAAAGDRAFLYFGMRRGGRNYYAVDVTNRNSPRLLWTLGPAELPGIGETWSQPTLARVRVGGAVQNGEKLVLIMGGGYDGAQENHSFVNDGSGHRLFMIDALSGALLWYAGGPGNAGAPDLALAAMRHSIPGRVTVLDLDGDQFADRMYAGDMGGRVWRFDIFNGAARGSLVTGGVLAALGNGGNGTNALDSNRRFYNAPDVALMQRRGAEPYYNIAIGSGYRGHPLDARNNDRFYAVRDRNPFGKLTQAAYSSLASITDAQLTDVTDNITDARVPAGSPGWKLELRLNGGWNGEKVLADAVTINGTVLFTTYQPEAPAAANPCLPANGRNRVYALRVDTAAPALDFNDNLRIDANDAFTNLATRGIAGEVTLVLESRLADDHQAPDNADELGRRGFCAVGVEVLSKCVNPGGVVRSFWQRSAPDDRD